MEYKSQNSGLLAVSMVKSGDKLVILADAYSTFSEKAQKTYWNCKVALPDGTHKLAGLMDSTCDEMAKKWGNSTENWTGHTLVVEIKTSKSGNPYIKMTPTDDPIIDVSTLVTEEEEKEVAEKPPVEAKKPIEYPKEEINPDDIPF